MGESNRALLRRIQTDCDTPREMRLSETSSDPSEVTNHVLARYNGTAWKVIG
jgi:hypothetical protein